jgi:hypothetical protein
MGWFQQGGCAVEVGILKSHAGCLPQIQPRRRSASAADACHSCAFRRGYCLHQPGGLGVYITTLAKISRSYSSILVPSDLYLAPWLYLQPLALCTHSTTPTMGNMLSQMFPPKPRFAVEQIPDLSGQVMIVTGYGIQPVLPDALN